jgi:hypothetical protein
MRSPAQAWLSAFLLLVSCALMPAGRLGAQPATGAPAAANALDQLTAPIALYPDALVVQMLAASKNYDALKSFAGWLEKNAKLKGSELQDAAQKAGFDPALVALAPFPQVVQMMAENPDWTKALGQAVTADKKGVSDSIQRLRAQALAVGNLKTTPQQTVNTQTNSAGQPVIIIAPANPQVIYVPVYSTQTVYVEDNSSANAAGAAMMGFTVGVIVGGSHHHYYDCDDYWDDREDYYEDRQENFQENQDQRQGDQDQRQSDRQANQDQRQSGRQENQGQPQSVAPSAQTRGTTGQPPRQSAAPTSQWQGKANQQPGPSGGPSAQSQPTPNQSSRQPAAATSGSGGGPTASQRSGMNSGGLSGYQNGSATRTQSSRGNSSRGGAGRGR